MSQLPATGKLVGCLSFAATCESLSWLFPSDLAWLWQKKKITTSGISTLPRALTSLLLFFLEVKLHFWGSPFEVPVSLCETC